MNKKLLILIIILPGLFLASCKKDSDVFVPDPGQANGPDTSWYNTITATMPVSVMKSNLVIPNYADTFVADTRPDTINTPFGLQCIIPAAACVTTAGQPVTGTVQVELALLKKKGDLILMNKPTTSNGRLLFSGGAAFVSMKKDGQELKLAPGIKIQLRFPAETGSSIYPNRLYTGDESNPDRFNWLLNTDPNTSLGIGLQNYEIQSNRLRWISCDSLYDTTGAILTTLKTELAPQFTNANTTAYIVMRDYRSVIAMYGDVGSHKFVSSARLPINKEVTIVVISHQGNDYFMDHRTVLTGITSTNPGNIQAVTMNPVITTLTNIRNYLSTL